MFEWIHFLGDFNKQILPFWSAVGKQQPPALKMWKQIQNKKRLMSPEFCVRWAEVRACLAGKSSPQYPQEHFGGSWGNNANSEFPGSALTPCSSWAALKLDLFYGACFSCLRKHWQCLAWWLFTYEGDGEAAPSPSPRSGQSPEGSARHLRGLNTARVGQRKCCYLGLTGDFSHKPFVCLVNPKRPAKTHRRQ